MLLDKFWHPEAQQLATRPEVAFHLRLWWIEIS
jgi:hypothetical protein